MLDWLCAPCDWLAYHLFGNPVVTFLLLAVALFATGFYVRFGSTNADGFIGMMLWIGSVCCVVMAGTWHTGR